ncbi:hypothetical protein HK151_12460 [Streptococcus agalactiae]|nr:hypothetical protein [Streptococcus agalactiae]
MPKRVNVYFTDETMEKFNQIIAFLKEGNSINKQHKGQTSTLVFVVDTFYRLFIEGNENQNYYERLLQLQKKLGTSEQPDKSLKAIHHQLDQLLYLELTNFHAITKGEQFDIQNLESIHSQFDPEQHELMARIEDVIKEDVSRGQTIKHSH